MGRADSMTVSGHRGSKVSWGGGSGKGNNGGGHKNRNRSPSNPSTTVAYYRDGVPYNAAGEVIITITGGPKLPPGVPSPAPGNYQVPTAGGFIYEVAVDNQNIITGVTVYPVTNNRGYVLANEAQRKNVASAFVDKILAPKRAVAEAAKAQAEWDAAHPVEVAERQVNEAEKVRKREQDNVTQKQAVRDSLKGTVEGRLLTDTAAYPLSYEKEDRLSIPGTNGFSLQLTFSVENREQMDKLLKDGGTAYVKNVLQWGEVSAPTESGLIVGNGIKTATAAEYENLRQRVLNRQNEINSAQTAFNIAIESRHQAEQRKKVAETHLNAVRQQVAADKKAQEEIDAVKDAVKFTADFYKELTSKYGDNASKIAQELADTAKGKQIRNVDEALKAFDQYKDVLNKKFSAKDREAIAKALESVDRNLMAKNLAKFSKALGVTSKVIDGIDIVVEFKKAVRTDIWRPFFVKLETLAAGAGASWLVAFAFAVLTATPLGIVGFVFLIAIVGFLINDELIEKINKDVLGV